MDRLWKVEEEGKWILPKSLQRGTNDLCQTSNLWKRKMANLCFFQGTKLVTIWILIHENAVWLPEALISYTKSLLRINMYFTE